MKNTKRGFVGISVLIFVFIGLVIISALMYLNYNQPDRDITQEENSDLSRGEALRDWKTYRNEKYGFEFKFPSEWTVIEHIGSNGLTIFNEKEGLGGFDVEIINNPEMLTAKQYAQSVIKMNHEGVVKTGVGYDLINSSNNSTGINGIRAYVIHDVFQFDQSSELIFVTNGEYMFQFSFTVNKPNPNLKEPEKNYKIVNQILNTFIFTKNTMKDDWVSVTDAIRNVKIGDNIGGFTVSRIEFPKIYTTGIVNVVGRYENPEHGIFGPEFNVSYSESEPRIKGDDRNYWFCFRNTDEAKAMLEPYSSTGKVVEIVIRDYIINLHQGEVCDSAELVSVAKE